VGALRVDKSRVWFNAFYVTEFHETVEEEAVTATYIQDIKPSVRGKMPMQHFKNCFLTRAPPPMSRVEVAVPPSVFRFQDCS
jgi:hypothetical protein